MGYWWIIASIARRQEEVRVVSENGLQSTLSVRRGRNPAVERRNGYAEVLGYVSGRDATGQQLLSRLDLAVCHLWLATTLATKLTRDFQPGTSALDRQLTLHFGEPAHDVEEEPA